MRAPTMWETIKEWLLHKTAMLIPNKLIQRRMEVLFYRVGETVEYESISVNDLFIQLYKESKGWESKS